MARVTAEERGEDLCHFSFHICGLLLGKWGGAGDEWGSGNRPRPGPRPRVSIRGNKGELLKQIMSESSARNAERHQKCIGSPPPRSAD